MSRKPAAKPATVAVRMTAVVSGGPIQINPGDVIEADRDEAERLVSIGAAVYVDPETD